MKPPYALCKFLENGMIFPVEQGFWDKKDAEQALNWQKRSEIGEADWRIVSMHEVDVDKLWFGAFIPEIQLTKKEHFKKIQSLDK